MSFFWLNCHSLFDLREKSCVSVYSRLLKYLRWHFLKEYIMSKIFQTVPGDNLHWALPVVVPLAHFEGHSNVGKIQLYNLDPF